ncbi:hypothetical protein ACLOAU_11365 [Niabella sp. CJ426]|uniref:hypothetical protein n=1 Tax=Niabella sp. CJ426 TaxID=3393740 RepID=UPI003D083554
MIDDSNEFQSLLSTVTEIAKADGAEDMIDLLTNSQITIQQTDYDNWNGGLYGYTIYICVDVKTFINHRDNIEHIEKDIDSRFSLAIRHLDNEQISRVSIIPKSYDLNAPMPNPHRPFSASENKRRNDLTAYLDKASEDELIEEILLPLFRQLGFHRISFGGHKDKALEYGKDIWMRYTLPTQHVLYFGIQVKKGKLDSSGITKFSNANVAEVYQQALMMLGHEIFDAELNRNVLVDHAFIVAGGEITKAAKNWIGGKLDVIKRSQVMFMDRNDILNLYVVTNLPLPDKARPAQSEPHDDLPF